MSYVDSRCSRNVLSAVRAALSPGARWAAGCAPLSTRRDFLARAQSVPGGRPVQRVKRISNGNGSAVWVPLEREKGHEAKLKERN